MHEPVYSMDLAQSGANRESPTREKHTKITKLDATWKNVKIGGSVVIFGVLALDSPRNDNHGLRSKRTKILSHSVSAGPNLFKLQRRIPQGRTCSPCSPRTFSTRKIRRLYAILGVSFQEEVTSIRLCRWCGEVHGSVD